MVIGFTMECGSGTVSRCEGYLGSWLGDDFRAEASDVGKRCIVVRSNLQSAGVRLVMGGVRICDEDHRIAECGRPPCRRIDAELAGVATDDDLLGTPPFEKCAQLRSKKGVRRRLAELDVVILDDEPALQLPALRAELERSALALVLNEDNRSAHGTGTLGERVDAIHHRIGLVGPRLIVEQAALDIDYEKG